MEQNNGKAVAALVTGSFPSCLGPVYSGWLGLIFGIIAIVLGNKARKETPCAIATAGFVCGIVGTAINALFFLGCICVAGLISNALTYSAI